MSNFIVLDQNELLNVVGGTEEEVDIVPLPYFEYPVICKQSFPPQCYQITPEGLVRI